MPLGLSWSWFFILGAIGYGVVLGLGCGGLVAYNLWNNKNVRRLRQRQEQDEFYPYAPSRAAGTSKDTLGDISDMVAESWRDARGPPAAGAADVKAARVDDSRRRSEGGSRHGLDGLPAGISTATTAGPESRRGSNHSLDGLSTISTCTTRPGDERRGEDARGGGGDSRAGHQTSSPERAEDPVSFSRLSGHARERRRSSTCSQLSWL